MNAPPPGLVPLRKRGVALLLSLAFSLPRFLAAADPPSQWETIGKETTGGFIVSLARDADGIWIGTEDKGVVHIPAQANPLLPGGQAFTRKDGAPDNAYALCADPKGRLWAGSLRHGVSIYGEPGASATGVWQTYDVLAGPLGERVFHIAVCPTDGDVWLATSAGLTRYSQKTDSWSYFTRAEGLPSDQANAIAFNSKGDIFVGTQCDGIALARAADEYKKWQAHGWQSVGLPTPTGRGLPTALINGLLVSKTGTVYAATSAGLAWSKDGTSWQYLRGQDYADKVRGRWGGAPRGWQAAPKANLLPEDYVTCLAESDDGLLWLGFRQHGYAALDPNTFRVVFAGTKKSEGLPDDFVTCILPMPDNRPYIGTYGGGVARAKKPMGAAAGVRKERKAEPKKEEKAPPLPSPAKPPTLEQLRKMLQAVEKLPAFKQPSARFLGDDWRTRGDWFGRYGRQYSVLCAAGSPLDHELATGKGYDAVAGLHPYVPRNRDGLRNWIHWLRTDDPRCLYNPYIGTRRQAEWDDHGEVYPMDRQGPDLWITVEVPAGVHRAAFYFFNKDGHAGNNRWRDFTLEAKRWASSPTAAAAAPTLARCRIAYFWGGVHKQFLLAGPAKYNFHLSRNHSFNTIVSSVFIDAMDPAGGPTGKAVLPCTGGLRYLPPSSDDVLLDDILTPPTEHHLAARSLWTALDQALVRQQASPQAYRVLAYRAALAAGAKPPELARWRWRALFWTDADRAEFARQMAAGYKGFLRDNPVLKKSNRN